MLCDKCKKNEAKIYYTEIINGEKKEQHLCEDCAIGVLLFSDEFTIYEPGDDFRKSVVHHTWKL